MYVPHLPPFAMPCVLLLQFNPGKDIWNQSSCTSSHYIACCRSPSMVEALLINVLVPACHYPAPVLSTSTMTKSNSVQWPRTIYSSSALEREREKRKGQRDLKRDQWEVGSIHGDMEQFLWDTNPLPYDTCHWHLLYYMCSTTKDYHLFFNL
jgi:hypothetical protein